MTAIIVFIFIHADWCLVFLGVNKNKVSDFGLTKFREDLKKQGTKEIQGSLHWTAPEILNETPDVDLVLADVYSFGIYIYIYIYIVMLHMQLFIMFVLHTTHTTTHNNFWLNFPPPVSSSLKEIW